MIKVRFAPSPTGIPHIGNTRTAFFNYLFAKANKGEFILRIEDTDQKRIVDGAEEAILEILAWLGIEHSEKIVHQSERLEIYKKYSDELLSKQIAYQKEGAVLIKMPTDKTFEWIDLVGNKQIKFKGKDQQDFVILKSDGFPTYHLANVIDDHLMSITHVIRGEEWISSTPKHLYLYQALGWTPPYFAHLPVILGADKSKLSKRHGAESVLDYKNKGYLKEALLNFMAMLGWNPGGDREIMSLEEIISLFDLKDVNVSNPIFDIKKLEWLNGIWIRSITDLDQRLLDFYAKDKEVLEILKGPKAKEWVSATSSKMKTLMDFKELVSEKLSERKLTEEEQKIAEKLFKFLDQELGSLEKTTWENENFLAALKKFSNENEIPFKTIYFLLTGKEHGIGLLELNQIYGKEFFINNLKS